MKFEVLELMHLTLDLNPWQELLECVNDMLAQHLLDELLTNVNGENFY
jgi:hypothetical protein